MYILIVPRLGSIKITKIFFVKYLFSSKRLVYKNTLHWSRTPMFSIYTIILYSYIWFIESNNNNKKKIFSYLVLLWKMWKKKSNKIKFVRNFYIFKLFNFYRRIK